VRVDRGLAGDPAAASHGRAGTVASIGNFDGVHRGHRRILDAVVAGAQRVGAEPAVVTFEPHPRCVLDPPHCPEAITLLDEKAELLAQAGVLRLVVLEFSVAMSRWSAAEFCARLHAALHLRALVVGEGFAFGHRRQGHVDFLRAWGAGHDVDVTVVEPLADGGGAISSSRIRGALALGDLDGAAHLLGVPYSVAGTAEPAARDGTGGGPSGQLWVPGAKALPAAGRYAAWLRVRDSWLGGVVGIGSRMRPGEPVGLAARLLEGRGESLPRTLRCIPLERLPDIAGGGEATAEAPGLDVEAMASARRVLAVRRPPAPALQPASRALPGER